MVDGFGENPEKVTLHTHNWVMTILFESFMGMKLLLNASTSCHCTRYGEKYLQKLVTLVKQYEVQENVELSYRSELYMYAG